MSPPSRSQGFDDGDARAIRSLRMKPVCILLGAVLAAGPLSRAPAGDATGADRDSAAPLTCRGSERGKVAGDDEIVDAAWIVIGNSEHRGGHLAREARVLCKGGPVYRFRAEDESVNRIELSELFGSAERLKGVSPAMVERLTAITAADILVDLGRYGDTVTYEWSTRFPRRMGPQSLGIFAQWHGRPDRTLVDDGKTVRMLSLAEFEDLSRTVEFREDGWGYERKSGVKTAYRRDAAAGGPIGEFRVGFDHLYLMVRSDASRRSSPDVKLKIRPSRQVGDCTRDGPKEIALVWKTPLADVPVDRWIDFKVRIHFSEYAPDADKVTSPGAVTVWMNGKQVADWRGNVGKNDSLGPYFKFGIYKPGPGGFQVDHAAYRRTIQRTRKSPEVPNPLRDEVLRSRAEGGDATGVNR